MFIDSIQLNKMHCLGKPCRCVCVVAWLLEQSGPKRLHQAAHLDTSVFLGGCTAPLHPLDGTKYVTHMH